MCCHVLFWMDNNNNNNIGYSPLLKSRPVSWVCPSGSFLTDMTSPPELCPSHTWPTNIWPKVSVHSPHTTNTSASQYSLNSQWALLLTHPITWTLNTPEDRPALHCGQRAGEAAAMRQVFEGTTSESYQVESHYTTHTLAGKLQSGAGMFDRWASWSSLVRISRGGSWTETCIMYLNLNYLWKLSVTSPLRGTGVSRSL